jgi:hypothetical protein
MKLMPLLWIVVPLGGALLFCLKRADVDWARGDVWMNLGTEFFGILVTVLYVERIVDRHKAVEWERVDRFVVSQLKSALLTAARHLVNWMETDEPPLLENQAALNKATDLETLKKHFRFRRGQMFASFANEIGHDRNAIQELLLTHYSRLSPERIETLSSIIGSLDLHRKSMEQMAVFTNSENPLKEETVLFLQDVDAKEFQRTVREMAAVYAQL